MTLYAGAPVGVWELFWDQGSQGELPVWRLSRVEVNAQAEAHLTQLQQLQR